MSIEPELSTIHKAVHNLLRSLSGSGEPPATDLDHFLLVQQEDPAGALPYAARRVVENRLPLLAEQDAEAAEILRRRFLKNETLIRVAYRLNVTEHTVSRRQRNAIKMLAEIIQQEETLCRRRRLDKWQAQMPPATYSHLFGLDEHRRRLGEYLLMADGPPVIALTGIGGIGKTALADTVTRAMMTHFRFTGIHWLRPEPSTMSGSALSRAHLLDQTFTDLLTALAIQPMPATPEERRLVARRRLKAAPHLVVIDNLENAAFTDFLPAHLVDLATPSKFLLTSRTKTGGETAVRRYIISELSPADAAALIRHQAAEIGLAGLAQAGEETMEQIYTVTGGNPLALKLVVGMADRVSLPRLLNDLVAGRPGRIEDTYRHIYWQTWQSLSQPACDLLQAMPLVSGDGGDLSYLQFISGLDDNSLAQARDELVKRSLLEVRGPLENRRYGIHRLTETFVRTEIIGWDE